MIQNSSAVETKQFLPLELIIEPVQLENFCPLMFVTILKGPIQRILLLPTSSFFDFIKSDFESMQSLFYP